MNNSNKTNDDVKPNQPIDDFKKNDSVPAEESTPVNAPENIAAETTQEAATLEIEHWKNKYLRALADYDNLEKRVNEQIKNQRIKSKQQLLNKFLDVLDTLYRAEIFINDPGLKMVKDNFIKILNDEQVTEMALVGKEYDPYLAEAIEIAEDEKNKNKIIEVLQKGYMLGDEVLRVARVKVGK